MALQDALETILTETVNRLTLVPNVGNLIDFGTQVEPGELVTLKLQPEVGPVLVTDLLKFPLNLPLGTLGAITGNLPVPLATSVTPRVTVEWKVKRGRRELKRGEDYIAPDGLNGIDLPLVLLPVFDEFRLNSRGQPVAPGLFLFEVTAKVTLSVLYRDIPPPLPPPTSPIKEAKAEAQVSIRLQLPGLLLPTVLVMTEDSNLRGAALVVVPKNSPVKSLEKIMETLRPIEAVLRKVTAVAKLAAFLTGLSDLLFILDNQPHVVFIARDEIKNLNSIDLIQNAWYTLNDIEAEDEISAMIMIGPNERMVTCYVRRDLKDGDGAFSLSLGSGNWAAIRYLHTTKPVSEPASSAVTVIKDAVFRFTPTFGGGQQVIPTDFGDELSSIEFGFGS
ncbi:MAG TPA: hypothetical protein VM864_15225 [Pyrinomonadaceae bacterium]|jgi:hypothetical protein|nr:hypothetical protein [Pyrinomonadaceae bacterium]